MYSTERDEKMCDKLFKDILSVIHDTDPDSLLGFVASFYHTDILNIMTEIVLLKHNISVLTACQELSMKWLQQFKTSEDRNTVDVKNVVQPRGGSYEGDLCENGNTVLDFDNTLTALKN